jgi:hypothetical protein
MASNSSRLNSINRVYSDSHESYPVKSCDNEADKLDYDLIGIIFKAKVNIGLQTSIEKMTCARPISPEVAIDIDVLKRKSSCLKAMLIGFIERNRLVKVEIDNQHSQIIKLMNNIFSISLNVQDDYSSINNEIENQKNFIKETFTLHSSVNDLMNFFVVENANLKMIIESNKDILVFLHDRLNFWSHHQLSIIADLDPTINFGDGNNDFQMS